jgi:hypothetical protein
MPEPAAVTMPILSLSRMGAAPPLCLAYFLFAFADDDDR